MAWIESHTVLRRHRKLIELARALRLRPTYVMGHLHALWHAALEQQEDGDLSSWSDDLIADLSGFEGDAPRYVSLLRAHGWLNTGNTLHDWLDYAGRYLETKYRRSNPERLVTIWAKHGRVYHAAQSPPEDGPKPGLSPARAGPPTLPLPTKKNKRSTPASAGVAALRAFVPRLTALLKTKLQPLEQARAHAIAQLSYREVVGMLRASPGMLEPLLGLIARLEQGHLSVWYLEQIRAAATIALNDERKGPPPAPGKRDPVGIGQVLASDWDQAGARV